MQTVIGVFGTRSDADQAVTTLERMGYNPHDISIESKLTQPDTAVGVKGGQAEGDRIPSVTAGIVIGGLAGILFGLATIPFPGFDAIFLRTVALGTKANPALVSAISGALYGALVGGVLGAMMERRATQVIPNYTESVSEGAVLLAVPATVGEDADRVRGIFQEYHAEQIRSISA